jgi:ABC-type glycerol-3-phosphate transport system permease component
MSGTTSRTHLAGLETAPPDIGRRRRPSLRLGSHAFLMLLLAGFLAPVVWALVSAFKPANDIIRSPLTFDPGTVTLDIG